MRTIKLTLQYDGTHYHGWQIQSRCETIQGTVLKALRTILNDDSVKLFGASRTDRGVHAVGQVAHFTIPERVSLTRYSFLRGLNSLTPNDIIIADVQEVHEGFHSRFDARGKTYCYQFFNADTPSMYHRRFSWHIRRPLDLSAMRCAMRPLLGCHDFSAFRAASCSAETAVRTVVSLHIHQRRDLVRLFIKADAYLHKMVRNIAGTLAEVGMDKRSPDDVRRALYAKDRTQTGVTAPPQGLFLIRVHY
ncbi:tRNA pseudouridine(38-40) synthase TruA [candidate division KSB3 bacterium]|uniref:tRNA pseudouridine synthase A n=1 Tax=candidate division KSB3 bacterium TaxID=2044937 RepID=A0A2G6E117_9BACT|nr:MAG: tRNA pseudouridine(38-40) synthase TruA [candidate division KSB3 bacterium]PIE30338.1 MAG: tRNA pseudouridine(38-40) synthase TruA [candidate division KSB3 bacterium]